MWNVWKSGKINGNSYNKTNRRLYRWNVCNKLIVCSPNRWMRRHCMFKGKILYDSILSDEHKVPAILCIDVDRSSNLYGWSIVTVCRYIHPQYISMHAVACAQGREETIQILLFFFFNSSFVRVLLLLLMVCIASVAI